MFEQYGFFFIHGLALLEGKSARLVTPESLPLLPFWNFTMSTIFQQNLRKKTAYDPDAEFQDASPDAYDAPSLESSKSSSSNNSSERVSNRVAHLPLVRESLIAADLIIEGKIEGKGNVRIAGCLNGDINIHGDLTVNEEAQLNGTLRARQVALAGRLEGNIESAERVELLDTAVLIGDLRTGTLTIAAGSRVRGSIECGWEHTDQPLSDESGNNADSNLVDFNTSYSYTPTLPAVSHSETDPVGDA